MSTNSRQIQSFKTNPMFVWQHVRGVESYTFRCEKKSSPRSIIWQRVLTVADAKEASEEAEYTEPPEVLTLEKFIQEGQDIQLLSFIYSKDLPQLEELVSYSISATAESKEGLLFSQIDIIVLESKTRKDLADLKEEIIELNNDILTDKFFRFLDSAAMSNTLSISALSDTGTTRPWKFGGPCSAFRFSLVSECG
jgi:hypothetical protein